MGKRKKQQEVKIVAIFTEGWQERFTRAMFNVYARREGLKPIGKEVLNKTNDTEGRNP